MLLGEARPWQVACEGGPPPHAGDPPSSRRAAASAGRQVEDHASAAFLSPHRPCGRRIISISGAQAQTSSRGAWQLQQCLGGAPQPAAHVGIAGKHAISEPAAPSRGRARDCIMPINHAVGPLDHPTRSTRTLSIRPQTWVPASDNVGGRWVSNPMGPGLRPVDYNLLSSKTVRAHSPAHAPRTPALVPLSTY